MAPQTSDHAALADLQPTQLYLNAAKLAAVLDRVDAGGFDPGPLPVYEFDGRLCLTDGHTRAFVAHLTGAERVAVAYDADLPEKHDVALYRECLGWCEEAGVESVPDLAGRVLASDTYEEEWVERCRRTAGGLEE